MINIIFPPGCYGTYLARCIYNYSNLRQEDFVPLTFDQHGSSHAHRTNNIARQYIKCGHLTDYVFDPTEDLVSIVPDYNHFLDYYNNHYYKQQHGQLISYLQSQMSGQEIKNKLQEQWNFFDTITDQITPWIVREWISFWINDCWKDGYNVDSYTAICSNRVVATDLLDNFTENLSNIIDKLKLTITVDQSIIHNTHLEFLAQQRFHGRQPQCTNWVNSVLNSHKMFLNDLTIFDEAYIQHLLRCNNYEVLCNNLNEFPKSSLEMRKLIYHI